jgi:hypothetical protein
MVAAASGSSARAIGADKTESAKNAMTDRAAI